MAHGEDDVSLDGSIEGQAHAKGHSVPHASQLCIALTGDSGIQFVSFAASRAALARAERTFCKDGDENDAVLQSFPSGAVVPPDLAEQAFTLDGAAAADVLLGEWLPMPCLRRGSTRGGADVPSEGPTNWVRLRLVPDGTDFRLVLAFDTWLANPLTKMGNGTLSPTLDDARNARAFAFAGDLDEIEPFIAEPWIDDWITIPPAVGTAPPGPRSLTRLAAYITLLAALKSAGLLAQAVISGAASGRLETSQTRAVDLSLVLGDGTIAAHLIDVARFEDGAETAVEPLAMRDLDRPWMTEPRHMPDAVAFTRPHFGNETLSRLSGRPDAFVWPSLVRVGRHARDLCLAEAVDASPSGRCNLIGSLLDEAPNDAVWRSAGHGASVQKRQPFVSGALLSLLTETGERVTSGTGRTRATRARFSNSGLMSLAIQEIVIQAITAINRVDLGDSNARRPSAHLRSVLITLPGNLQAVEVEMAHRRIRDGVALAYEALRWPDAMQPDVVFAPLRAQAVQYAYLHNEIAHRLAGRATSYLRLLAGPVRPAGSDISIATLDLDASGLTLNVSVVSSDPDTHLKLTHSVEDTAGIGLDDAITAIGRRIVVPAMVRHLEEARLAQAAKFVSRSLQYGDGPTDGFAKRFMRETIRPAALRLLIAHQGSSIAADLLPVDLTLRALLDTAADHVALQRLQDLAVADGANATTLLDSTIVTTAAEVRSIVADALGPALRAACQTIRRHRCSLLLLAGHPVAMSFLRDAALREASVTPDRIVDLTMYRFGAWTGPPKDVAAISAAGAALATRHTSKPAPQQRQFVGFEDGTSFARAPMFSIDPTFASGSGEQTHTFAFDGASRAIGVSQMNVPHWPLRPLARLDVSDADAVRRAVLPLTVTLALKACAGLMRPAALEVSRVRDARGRQLPPTVLEIKVCTSRDFIMVDDAPTGSRTEVRA